MSEKKEAVFKEGNVILKRGQKSGVIGVIQKGTVHMRYGCMEYDLQELDVVGLGGLDANQYTADYTALENDTKVVFYRADSIEYIEKLFEDETFRAEEGMQSVINQAGRLGTAHETMNQVMKDAADFIKKQYITYLTHCKKVNHKPVLSHALKDVASKDWRMGSDYIKQYFLRLNQIEPETLDAFFSSGDEIDVLHAKLVSAVFAQFVKVFDAMEEALKAQMELLCAPSGENLFSIYMDLLKAPGASPDAVRFVLTQLEKILDYTANVEDQLSEAYVVVDKKSSECQNIYDAFSDLYKQSQKESAGVEEAAEPDAYGFGECVNHLDKLLSFCSLEEERKQAFRDGLNAYRSLSDKKGQDDNARRVRKTMTELFYELYENVFLKAEEEGATGAVLDLFLNYGLVDETLFSEEKLKSILQLSPEGEEKHIHVYTARQWLHAIYVGEKEPSKNDLDVDYQESIREKERKENLSKDEVESMLNDQEAKIHFELEYFVRMNSRLTNGELSVFCPVLTEESFTGNPEQMFVTTKKLNDAIDWLLDLDYAVFHREKMYYNKENGIANMLINVQVFPDIILMPNVGSKSRMWQEIEGKFRDTPARFTFPSFISQDIHDLIVQAAGAFRWQMCKRIQGNYWNVVSEKSLTSEYYDYIQFYKKNKDLTDKAKEKINSQLQRARNNFGDCFVMDYALWVKNEVNGSMRLNKIAREILATYCAPIKEYRERLKRQPMFVEAFARYDRNKMKKVKEINNRRAAIRNANGVETEEFINEAKFQEET